MHIFSYFFARAQTINMIVATAAFILCLEFIRIVKRKPAPSFPWMAYATAAVLFGIACKRTAMVAFNIPISPTHFAIQLILDIAIAVSAAFIPWVRARTYKRLGLSELESLNKELQYRKQLFENFMDHVPAAVFLKDSQRNCMFANQALCNLLNKTCSNIIGHRDILETESDRQRDKQQDLEVWQSNQSKEFQQVCLIGGQEIMMLMIKFPLKGTASEQLIGGIIIDLTEQARRKARIDFLASIVELSPDAIYSYDSEGIVLSWNSAAEKLFGYRREEIIGKSIDVIVPEHKRQERKNFAKQLISGESSVVNIDTERLHRDGFKRSVWISGVLAPSLTTPEPIIALITKDMTRKRDIAEEIRQLDSSLQKQIQELSNANTDLQRARDQAMRAARTKASFVTSITHELRTPLSGVLGMSELILRKELPENARTLIEMIYQSAQTLLHVINEILDFSRLEAGKATVENIAFNLPILIRECMDAIKPAADEKKLEISISIEERIPDAIEGDRVLLKEVLLHLLENAIKFTSGGKISLTVDIEDISDTSIELLFCIRDTGIGIADEMMADLFTPFSNITPWTTGLRDTGLGLALSKRMVELMGGDIWAESMEGIGSDFFVKLAFKPSTLHTAPAIETDGTQEKLPTRAELTKTKVLVVEDNPVLARLTLRQLSALGIYATTANTGKRALQLAEANSFDIVLLDLHLPDISGFELAKQLRALEARKGAVRSILVALTGSSVTSDRESAANSDMDDYLVKPIVIEQLERTIRHWTRGRHAA